MEKNEIRKNDAPVWIRYCDPEIGNTSFICSDCRTPVTDMAPPEQCPCCRKTPFGTIDWEEVTL